MLPPYDSDEVAEAVQRRMQRAGLVLHRLVVTADDHARAWRIDAWLHDGREVVTFFPFSSPEGIHTPAELADWFAGEAESS